MDPLPSRASARHRVTIGEVVAGKYRVERLVGEGGMGIVVAARHLQLDTTVALKLLPESAANDSVLVERFLREARAAARLRSEHVAKVLDVGTLSSGTPYMVMEYLEGANLADVLSAQGRFDPTTACDYVLQACEAVAEAHALGIVHRDLKPENLYLTTRLGGAGFVKVIDFGVSKATTVAGGLTTTSAVVGSPMYMAPEQMRSSRVADPRSDVWALGVVLYELLTERCPFEADSLPELCLKITRDPHSPLGGHRRDLPPKLVAIVERCLQKDPASRYANAAELAAALEPFAPAHSSAEATSARRVMQSLTETMAEHALVTEPPPRAPAKRGRWMAAAAIVASGAVLLAARSEMHPASGPARLALAAVNAVRSVSSFAQESESSPEMLAPLEPSSGVAIGGTGATGETAAPASSAPAASPPRSPHAIIMMRPPTRLSPPLSPAARTGDDDIPAYR